MWSQERPALFGKRKISDGGIEKQWVRTDILLFPSMKNLVFHDLVQYREADNLSSIVRNDAFDGHPQFVLMPMGEPFFQLMHGCKLISATNESGIDW